MSQEQQTYTWQETETQVIPLVRNFVALGEYDTEARRVTLKLPKSLIYSLFALIDEWKRNGVLYLPRMAYTLCRLEEAVLRSNTHVEWGGIKSTLMAPKNMSQLRTALTWLELLCRSGLERQESAQPEEENRHVR